MKNSIKADRQKMAIAMARACLTKNELQKIASVGMNQINAMIEGRNVRPCTFGKICKALGVDVVELLATEKDIVPAE